MAASVDQVRLFGARLSPFVEKVARALALKGIDFELVPPRSPLHSRSWNPQTGKMPVLEIDGERVFDSTFILRRLDEICPAPPLYAREPGVAALQRQLEDWADESLYWYLMALRWAAPNARATAEQLATNAPVWLRPAARRLLPRMLIRMTRAQGLGRLPHDVLVAEYGRLLDDLVWVLGDHRFFHADEPSGADLAIYGQFCTARSGPTPECEQLLSHRPALSDWAERVEERTAS